MAENTQVKEEQKQDNTTTTTLEQLMALVRKQQEQIEALTAQVSKPNPIEELVAAITANGEKKNGRGGRHQAQAVLDTKTGKVYRTKASAGMAVAPEYGLKVHNFVWYELVKGTKTNPAKCPDRFKEITQEEYDARLKKQEVAQQGNKR